MGWHRQSGFPGLKYCAAAILIAWRSAVCAQEPLPARNCLWEARKGGAVVYLQGSVHLLREDNYPLNRAIEDAFNRSTTVVFEVNLDEAAALDVQKRMLELGVFKDGRKLGTEIGRETYERTRQALTELGQDMKKLERFKPWLMGVWLSIGKMQAMGFSAELGLDSHFFRRAGQTGKRIATLETAEEQLALFDGLAPRTQEKFLLQTLEELADIGSQIEEVLRAWSTGDTASLERHMLDSFKEYPEIYEPLLAARNRKWADIINKFTDQDGPVMVVVGAAHLVGRDNLTEIMRSKGWDVEQR